MANTKKSSKGRTTRRPSKVELERQQALKRMLFSLAGVVVILLGAIRLGAFGVTVYNLFRLFFGSVAYLPMAATVFYLFFFKWVHNRKGSVSGFIAIMFGLMLIFQAYLVWILKTDGNAFGTTLSRIFADLTHFQVTSFVGGGALGALLYMPTSFLFANIGTYFIGALLLAIGALQWSNYSIYDLMDLASKAFKEWQEDASIKRQERFLKKEEARALREEEKRLALQKAEQDALEAQRRAEQVKEAVLVDEADNRRVDLETGEILDGEGLVATSPQDFEVTEPEIVGADFDESLFDMEAPVGFDEETGDYYDSDFVGEDEPEDEEVRVNFTPKEAIDYKLPTLSLFAPDKPKNQSKEKQIVRENIKILEETFNSFGIKATVERAEIGPSVTKYEVKPAVGVRVNRIANLADDLALALAAKDVRIEAPIPGKSLIGIEVPNSEVATVSFRELWEQANTDPNKLLEVPLGKAVNGSVRSFDLTRMPHLLVAGSTGSGKSVAVNGIISSILMKARPDEVKFMMVDPKMVELSVYNDIPHLLIPVVTNPRKAARALQKVVDEMENRYELFSKVGARNIEGFNAKVAEYNAQSEMKQIPLPLIVVIVDELADLMMVASKEVEDAIIRLGQKARAAGIHMILATQRPSVDVISGLIKANVPSRIAFAVSSGTDSRTILDVNGAEKLLGRGDMLFSPIGESHPVRLQGSFISDQDVENIVDFIKRQADAEYDETFDPGEVSESDDGGFGGSGADDAGDPLFEDAKALVIETQKASASMIQRRLSVGFNRATRLMEELEAAGVIGPAEGTKPRKVLQTS